MKVVVTGGSGFIGSYVVRELVDGGHEVTVFDIQAPKDERVRHIAGDLTDLDQVTAALKGSDGVCHIAAIGDVYRAFEDPPLAARVNVLGTSNVLEGALRIGAQKVVYASTWEVYGPPQYEPIDEKHPCNPDHPYNITKYGGDLLTQSYRELKGLDTIVLRLGTANGKGMRQTAVVPAFILRALRKEPITINGTGEQYRQFTHASDIARGFRLALEKQSEQHVFNLVSEEKTSIMQIAQAVIAQIPTEIRQNEARVGDVAPAVICSASVQSELGWKAGVTFADSVRELIEVLEPTVSTADQAHRVS